MSARAASRLTGLGFTVYRYQAGKMDWFAAGLPREGSEANVLDADRVVLGLVGPDGLTGDPAAGVEELMDLAPVTFRPNLRVGEMPAYLKKQRVQHALVTTNDGILVGLIEL